MNPLHTSLHLYFLQDALPVYTPADKAQATRKFSEIALNALAKAIPEVIGGSADLTPSNLTELKCSGDFQKNTPAGRYIRYVYNGNEGKVGGMDTLSFYSCGYWAAGMHA